MLGLSNLLWPRMLLSITSLNVLLNIMHYARQIKMLSEAFLMFKLTFDIAYRYRFIGSQVYNDG